KDLNYEPIPKPWQAFLTKTPKNIPPKNQQTPKTKRNSLIYNGLSLLSHIVLKMQHRCVV
ncbi:hypothetical protein, partial [Pelistega suis]|uniref:hypothetical protein n=1 Tax=Pelistega suis TaxID=1631957 RepID=UPI00211CFC54